MRLRLLVLRSCVSSAAAQCQGAPCCVQQPFTGRARQATAQEQAVLCNVHRLLSPPALSARVLPAHHCLSMSCSEAAAAAAEAEALRQAAEAEEAAKREEAARLREAARLQGLQEAEDARQEVRALGILVSARKQLE